MKNELKTAYWKEIARAQQLIREDQLQAAFHSLELAHVLGQKHIVPHTVSHLYMLKIGWINKDSKEILGQILRIPLGIIGSLLGFVPFGNSGGSNMPLFQKKNLDELPAEIRELLKKE